MANSTIITDYLGKGTHAARPATPPIATGALAVYYETDTSNTFAWSGSAWVQVNASAGSSTLAGDTDVSVASPSDTQALQYVSSASKWQNINLTATHLAALPTAASTNVGQIIRIPGDGSTTPDKLYVCRQRADGSYIWTRFQGRSVRLKMCSADFTPTATGVDKGGLFVVPYDPDENGKIPITWNVIRMFFRVETAASTGTTSVKIQRSTGAGTFTNAGYLNTTSLDIASGSYESDTSTFAQTTVNSGDKLMPEYTALGTGAAGFSLFLVLRES